ncbi:hypothetical protein BU16DRAFT_553641 [Lophium mytilinum]|uniref:Uncharacterized protein n=1 Tax=Lophium mytilinum TaxID=390894 RepID=A0A6A6QA08_9PEZI|nr:hypothetical protein BU16DRAFT_553641 [Lophium mytilinum]
MQPGGVGEPSDFLTATLFDDAIYQREVLSLPECKNEDELDQEILEEARQLGITVTQDLAPDLHDISTALSTFTVSSERRSSMSVRSHESHSTGFTSDPSRNSKDQCADNHPASPSFPPPRSSISIENRGFSVDVPRPTMRHAQSSSTTSKAGSARSLLLVSERPGLKRRRGSSLLSMFRREPQQCSSCSARLRHSHHVNPFTPRLPCGHSLTKYAIRIHVQDALERDALPSCCGRPLPKPVLEMALTEAELDSLSKALPLLDETENGNPTKSSEHNAIEVTRQVESPFSVSPDESGPPSPFEKTPEECARLDKAMEDDLFRTLRAQQTEQLKKIVSFEARQRQALLLFYEQSKSNLSSALAHSKVERINKHTQHLEQLEEAQVAAEHDLRRAQVQENQNMATALKYMEAYCNGPNSSGHTVSEEDRKKLKRQHTVQDSLPRKHDSAINVLRSKQEKDVKVQMHKQHTELVQMDLDFEKELGQLDAKFHRDSSKLDVLAEVRRRKAIARWDLRMEIWRRQFEKQHETCFDGSIPHPDWPATPMEGPAGDATALAPYFQLDYNSRAAT